MQRAMVAACTCRVEDEVPQKDSQIVRSPEPPRTAVDLTFGGSHRLGPCYHSFGLVQVLRYAFWIPSGAHQLWLAERMLISSVPARLAGE